MPFILKEEESHICQEIEGKQLSVILDGTYIMSWGNLGNSAALYK